MHEPLFFELGFRRRRVRQRDIDFAPLERFE